MQTGRRPRRIPLYASEGSWGEGGGGGGGGLTTRRVCTGRLAGRAAPDPQVTDGGGCVPEAAARWRAEPWAGASPEQQGRHFQALGLGVSQSN